MRRSGGNEPASAEQKAGAQGRHEYRATLLGFAAERALQNRIKSHTAGRGAEIPKFLGYGGKSILGQTQLLGEERDKTRIGLMSRQTLHRGPCDAAAEFDVQDHLLQLGDGRARECFAIKMQIEISARRLRQANRSRVLARTAKEQLSKGIGLLRRGAGSGTDEKRTGAVAEQAAEFSRDAAGPENAAVNIGGNDDDGARLSRSNEGLGDDKSIQQAETRTADIERATCFACEKLRVKER